MEGKWQTAEHFDLPQSIKEWLFYRSSMTVRLRQFAQSELTIQLLSHDWRAASRSEARYLRLDNDLAVVGREVVLRCDQAPWIYAHSVLPKSLIEAKGASLLSLGARPIGELLFADANIVRSDFQFQLLSPGVFEFDQAIQHSPSNESELWARRSTFRFPDCAELAITEVFFPYCWLQNP